MPTYDVAVVGGGAVGVSTAHELASHGAKVILLEQGLVGMGCSYGNAGLIVPSFCLPLATPRALATGVRWLLGGDGPFTLRPRLDRALWAWLLRYTLACRPHKVKTAIRALHTLGKASLERYREFADSLSPFGFESRGWLHVFLSEDYLLEATKEAGQLRAAGVEWQAVDGVRARELCPALTGDVVGGVYFPAEAHLQPDAFVNSLATQARQRGLELREHSPVLGLTIAGRKVKEVHLEGETLQIGCCVIAAGAESAGFLQKLAIALPIEPGKGNSLTWNQASAAPDIPLMLGELHVIVTPMAAKVRMTTGLDLAGFDSHPDLRRLKMIRRAGERYLPGLVVDGEPEAWFGYRPLTPDSLPIIGPMKDLPNLFLATGHGQLGMTLAPITGKLVSELVRGVRPSVDMAPFLPARFGL